MSSRDSCASSKSLRAKSSTLGASEYPQTENARTIGGKNRKSIRENPRDQPAPASSVHPRQKSMRGSARKANIDDVERQLREVASSALRKSPPPPKKGDLLVARDKQPGGTLGRRIDADAEAAAAGATSHRGLMQMASWRPVILQTYSERSVVSRCARSLALPLLLLSLGAGTLVVLSPEGALTNIDHSLEDARARQAGREDQKPSQGAVATAASFDQPSRSIMPAEPLRHAMVSSVAAPGGEAGLTQPPVSPGSPSPARVSPGETSTLKPHDAAEMVPIRVADDDQKQSPSALDPTSPSSKRQLLDAGAAAAAAPSAQAEIVEATGSPNAVIAPRSGALPGGVASEARSPVMAGLTTPQTSISLPTDTPSPTADAAASPSPAIETHDSHPGSSGDAVSEAPPSVLAALATPDAPTSLPAVTPSPTPDEAVSPSLAAKSIEPKSGSNREAGSEAPAPVAAGSATPQASTSLPTVTPSPPPDAAASSSLAIEPNGSNPGSSGDALSETRASVLAALATPEAPTSLPAVTPSPTPDEAVSPSLAAKSIEPKSGSNREAGSEAPAPVAAGSATPQASTSLPTVTPSPPPDAAASSSLAIEPNGSNPGSSGDALSETRASVLAALATPEAPTSLPAVTPSPTPDEAVSPSLAAKSIEPKSGSNSEAGSETPAPVVAGLTTPQASTSLPIVTPSPPPDAAASPSIAIETHNSNPGSSVDAVSEAPASVLAALATSEVPKPLPTVTPSPRSDDAAPTKAEIVASIPLLAATSLPTPPEVSPSGAPDRVASRPSSTDEAVSQVSSSAMAGLATSHASTSPPQATGSPAPDRAASSKAENIASDESIHSRPRLDGETVVDAAAPLATQEAPASPPPVAASPPNTFAQVTPGTPIERAKPPVAHLIVAQRESGAAGAALPLPVSLSSVPAGAMIVINGLAAGSTLTEGRALETGGWQLTAGELHDAVLRPPQGFVGAMELGLELRLSNDGVADRKMLHLEWAASAGSQATKPAFVVRQLDSDELAALLKRGEGFIASGDLASARLVLQRAAEAGEAQAALSLAGTFDPIVLDKLGLQGQKADIEKARIWYQRAQELGSAAAPRRLQLLAGYDQ